MKLEEETYREIDRFLLGELTESEEVAFRARMEIDPELKKAVELEADVNLAIQYDGRIALKEKLRMIDQELVSEEEVAVETAPEREVFQDASDEEDTSDRKEKADQEEKAKEFIKSRRGIPWLAIAASILLLIAPLALFQLYLAGSGPADMVRVAIAEAQPQLNRGSAPDLLKESLSAFGNDEYDKAEQALISYEEQEAGTDFKPSVLEYHGLILLRQDRPGEAIPYLRKAVEIGNYPDEYWLLSLALFHQNNKEECLTALDNYLARNQTSLDPKIQDHVEIAQDLRGAILEELAE